MKHYKEFIPFSAETQNRISKKFTNGNIPCLSLDLGSKCTSCACIYCDTPYINNKDENKLSITEIKKIIDYFAKYELELITICGLGEPSEDECFFEILEYATKFNIGVQFFTNGLCFSEANLDKLAKFKAYPIFKFDSLNDDEFDNILRKKGGSKRIKHVLNYFLEKVKYKISDSITPVAVNIVPSKINVNAFDDLLKFCIQNSIFPSIGDLEFENEANKNIEKLKLSDQNVIALKKKSEPIIGKYVRNLCAGAYQSFRIGYDGNVLIGKDTGLSCVWPLSSVNSAVLEKIGNIRDDDIEQLILKIRNYRLFHLENTIQKLININVIFSAGGATYPKLWIDNYINDTKNKVYGKNIDSSCYK